MALQPEDSLRIPFLPGSRARRYDSVGFPILVYVDLEPGRVRTEDLGERHVISRKRETLGSHDRLWQDALDCGDVPHELLSVDRVILYDQLAIWISKARPMMSWTTQTFLGEFVSVL